MKRTCLTAVVAMIAVFMGFAHELRLGIVDSGPNVLLNVSGSPGVHQIQRKSDLRAAAWQSASLTTETNIAVPKDEGAQFFQAKAGPEADNAIVANAHGMIDSGRQIFRYDTFGSESFWGGKLR